MFDDRKGSIKYIKNASTSLFNCVYKFNLRRGSLGSIILLFCLFINNVYAAQYRSNYSDGPRNWYETCLAAGEEHLTYDTYFNSSGAPARVIPDKFGRIDRYTINYSSGGEFASTAGYQCQARTNACTHSQVWDAATQSCVTVDQGENLGEGSCSAKDSSNDDTNDTNYGKPIDIRLGNEHFSHTDVVLEGPASLSLTRYYNSHPSAATGSFGKGWTHSFDRQVQIDTITGHAAVRLVSGASRFFDNTTGGYVPRVPGRNLSLTSTGAGFEVVRGQSTETYNAAGNLIRIETLDGHTTVISRDASEKIQQVQLDGQATLNFTYGANGLVSKVTDSTGRAWNYAYDANNSLISVINPDTTTLTYHYEDPSFPHAVTGVTNELGVRYATIAYDAEGRAISSELANGVQRYDVSYNGSLSRSIQGPDLGAAGHEITLTPDRGKLHNTKLTTGLGMISKSLNADGLIAAKTTAGGRTTEYPAHDAKGNPTQIVKASGTAEEVTQQVTYHPSLGVPTEVREPSVYVGAEKVTTTTWDAYGNPTAISIAGFTPAGVAVSRTTSMEYDGPYHQLTKIDGARTNVNDWMQFEYWPVDSSPNSARLKKATDAIGNISFDNAQYSATGKLLSYDLPNGLSVSMTYYPGSDRLEKTTQSSGTTSRTTRWTYNAAGKVNTITSNFGTADAQTVTMAYDAALRLTRVTDAEGNYVEYTLDDNGNATNISQYDDTGVLLQTLDSLYDDYGRLKDISSGALQLASQTLGPDDELLSTTDGNGVRTDYHYDGLLRLTQEVRDSEGGYKPVDFAYDVANQMTANTVAGDITTTYAYDDLGNRVSETSPDRGMLTYTHDPAGNTTSVTNALGQVASMSYDAAGRPVMIDREGTTNDVSFVYDIVEGCANGTGKLCQTTDSSGTVTYSYTPFGELASKARTIDSVNYTTSYIYDANGRLINMTLPTGRTLSLTYDVFGHPKSIADGTHTYVSSMDWRGDDLIDAISFGNGLVDNRTYSANLARLVGQDISAIKNKTYSHDNNGNILQIYTNSLLDEFRYDPRNRLIKSNQSVGEGQSYDADSMDPSKSHPDLVFSNNNMTVSGGGLNVWYNAKAKMPRTGKSYLEFNLDSGHYFTLGLARVGLGFEEAPCTTPEAVCFFSGYGFVMYNNIEVATSEPFGASDIISIAFDADTGSVWMGKNGVWIQGNPSTGESPVLTGFTGEVFATFGLHIGGYSAGQITAVFNQQDFTYTAPAGFGRQTVKTDAYAYDDNGNRLSVGEGVGATDYSYAMASNRLMAVGSDSLIRDATGNRSSDKNGNRTFYYDSAGRLIEIQENGIAVASYAYNHANQRVSKTTAEGTVHYHHDDSGRLWAETDGQGNAIRDYIWMGDIPVAMVDYTGVTEQVTYLHADHLNTPRYATDETGTLVWQWSSDAFGNGVPNQDPDGDGTAITLNLRFPGQYYDAESGLHYNWNRYYDPAIGRYITSDPIGLDGGLNTFGYVGGNPLVISDPSGLYWEFNWKRVAGVGVSGTAGRGWMGLSGGYGVELRQCCKDGEVYNELYHTLRAGVGVGRSLNFSATGKGNIPGVEFASSSGLPKCMQLDYVVGKPFGSGNIAAGQVTARISGNKTTFGYAPGGKGVSASVNIIERRWLISSQVVPGETCGCK